jgi:hypothetical protein
MKWPLTIGGAEGAESVDVPIVDPGDSAVDHCEVDVSFRDDDPTLYATEYSTHVYMPRYRASFAVRCKYRIWCAAMVIQIVLATAVTVYLVGSWTANLHLTLISYFCASGIWTGVFWILWRRIPHEITARRLLATRYRVRVEPQGVRVRTEDGEYTFYWKTLDNVVATEHFLIFLHSRPGRSCYPVPFHCFGSREAAGRFLSAGTGFWKAAHGPEIVNE